MQVRVLGPVEVVADDGRLLVPSHRQKAVLALLTMHAGRSLTTDRILDELWEEPPGRTTLPFHISKLRSAIGQARDDPAGLILTTPVGYELNTADHQVDALEYAQILQRAREFLADRPAASARLLSQALGMWRGSAYAEFQYDRFAQPEIERLDESRIEAVEDRIEADLALGRHSGLIAELENLVHEHPLRERLRSQLMLCLYRSGMQAQALRAFQDTRKTLGEELGLEPGPDLVALEDRILLQEPDLKPGTAAMDEKPYRLPPDVSTFVGREDLIRECVRLLGSVRILTLVGSGGIGKTRLALAVGRGLEPKLADGAVLVRLDNISEGADPYSVLHDTLGLPHDSNQDSRIAVLKHFGPREMLVVLDNCEHVLATASSVAREILETAPGVSVLATSRAPLRVVGEQLLRVAGLSLPEPGKLIEAQRECEAVRLFLERAEQIDPEFVIEEQSLPEVAAICRSLDGIPLALELAAARLSTLSIEEIRERVDRQLTLLADGPRAAPARHRSLDGSLRWSYDLLDSSAQLLFRRLSVTRGGFRYGTVEALAGDGEVGSADVLSVLTDLVDSSLVDAVATSPVRYHFLEPVRQFAEALLAESRDADIAAELHANHYAAEADATAAAMGTAQQMRATSLLRADRPNLEVALEWLVEHERLDRAADVVSGLSRWWVSSGYHREADRWLHRLLDSEDVTDDRRLNLLRDGAYLALMRGHQDEAADLVEQQRVVAEVLNSDLARAHCAYADAEVRWVMGDSSVAIDLWKAALRLYRDVDPASVLFTLVNLGYALAAVGDSGAAGRIADQILDPIDGNLEPEAEAFASSILARAAYRAGDLDAMQQRSMDAYEGFERVGFEHHAASALHDAGLAMALTGDRARGIEAMQTALRSHQRLGDRLGEDRCRVVLGVAHADAGDIAAAARAIAPAVRALPSAAEPFLCAKTALVLALIAVDTREFERAAVLVGIAIGRSQSGSQVWPRPLEDLLRRVEAATKDNLDRALYDKMHLYGQEMQLVSVARFCFQGLPLDEVSPRR